MTNEEIEKQFDSQFPNGPHDTFNKGTFSFTNKEGARIASLDVNVNMGKIAEAYLNQILYGPVVERLGIKKPLKILYDAINGTCIIYSEKNPPIKPESSIDK